MSVESHGLIFKSGFDSAHSANEPEFFAESAYIKVQNDFARFCQPDDMFSRGFWDKKVKNKMTAKFYRSFVKPLERARDEHGFQQRDFAVRNGPWTLTEILAERSKADDRRDGFTDDFAPHLPSFIDKLPVEDEQQSAQQVKKIAKLYGADLVGITSYDDRWTYRSRFSARKVASKPVHVEEGLDNVIVVAKSMNYDVLRTSPSATASTGPAIGYADDAVTLLALAQ